MPLPLPDLPTKLTAARQSIAFKDFVNPRYESSEPDIDNDEYYASASVAWINGLPSVFISERGRGYFSDLDLTVMLCRWLPSILPNFIARLYESPGDVESVMHALLQAVNTKLSEWHSPRGLMRFLPKKVSFACALCFRCPQTDMLKLATLSVGTDSLILYNPTTRQYQRLTELPSFRQDVQNENLPSENLTHASVSLRNIAPGDTLVALTRGTSDVLFTNDVTLTFQGDCDLAPPALFTWIRERVKSGLLDASLKNIGVLIATATIPPDEIALRIRADTLVARKIELIRGLYGLYPDGLRLFGRRHNQRREAVCAAIHAAKDYASFRTILTNQYELTQNLPVTDIHAEILSPRWSQPHTVKNHFAADSLYKAAIFTLYNRMLAYENAVNEDEHCICKL